MIYCGADGKRTVAVQAQRTMASVEVGTPAKQNTTALNLQADAARAFIPHEHTIEGLCGLRDVQPMRMFAACLLRNSECVDRNEQLVRRSGNNQEGKANCSELPLCTCSLQVYAVQ